MKHSKNWFWFCLKDNCVLIVSHSHRNHEEETGERRIRALRESMKFKKDKDSKYQYKKFEVPEEK